MRKLGRLVVNVATVVVVLFFGIGSVWAADKPNGGGGSGVTDRLCDVIGCPDTSGWTDIGDIPGTISAFLTIAHILAGVVLVGVLILGGYKMMFSAGDPQKVAEGQQTIVWGIIGGVVVLSSYLFFEFVVGELLGIKVMDFGLTRWF